MEGPARRALEQRIELHRAELGSAMHVLRRSTARKLSPAEHFRREPYPWIAAAFGIGFLIAVKGAARDLS
jgi:hypothetical protein